MSTKEKIYDIVDVLNSENIEIVYQVLKRFAIAQSVQENDLCDEKATEEKKDND